MDVALDGGHQDPAPGLRRTAGGLRLDEGDEVGDRLLHDPGRLHDLGQEHLAGPEQVADDVHAVHQRALDDLDRTPSPPGDLGPEGLGVLFDEGVDALHQGMGDALAQRQGAPGLVGGFLGGRLAPEPAGDLDEALGGVGPAVQDHVLDPLGQLGIEPVVDGQRPGIDDAHVHAGLDGVEEEHRVDGLPDRVVAAERERDV